MTHRGKAFGVDLYGLEQVAKSDLPTVAGAYESAENNCNSANSSVNGLPNEPQQFVGEHGSVFNKFDSAHGAVRGLLKQTHMNLHDTADALQDAVNEYAERDRAAAAELQRIIDERGKPKPE